jgi:hypothetical protein
MTKLQKWWVQRNHLRFRLLGLINLFQEANHEFLSIAERYHFICIRNNINNLNNYWQNQSDDFKDTFLQDVLKEKNNE